MDTINDTTSIILICGALVCSAVLVVFVCVFLFCCLIVVCMLVYVRCFAEKCLEHMCLLLTCKSVFESKASCLDPIWILTCCGCFCGFMEECHKKRRKEVVSMKVEDLGRAMQTTENICPCHKPGSESPYYAEAYLSSQMSRRALRMRGLQKIRTGRERSGKKLKRIDSPAITIDPPTPTSSKPPSPRFASSTCSSETSSCDTTTNNESDSSSNRITSPIEPVLKKREGVQARGSRGPRIRRILTDFFSEKVNLKKRFFALSPHTPSSPPTPFSPRATAEERRRKMFKSAVVEEIEEEERNKRRQQLRLRLQQRAPKHARELSNYDILEEIEHADHHPTTEDEEDVLGTPDAYGNKVKQQRGAGSRKKRKKLFLSRFVKRGNATPAVERGSPSHFVRRRKRLLSTGLQVQAQKGHAGNASPLVDSEEEDWSSDGGFEKYEIGEDERFLLLEIDKRRTLTLHKSEDDASSEASDISSVL